MGQHYRLELRAEGLDSLVVDGDFTDPETAILEQYLEQYEAITASPVLSAGLTCNMNLQWTADSATVECDLPDEDTLGILLHRLRPFILSQEPASYEKVIAIVGRRVPHPAITDLLRRQRRVYDGREFQETMRISVNDTVINSDRTLKDWLNSHEYHRDADKREAVSSLLHAFPGNLTKGILVNMLIDRMRACINLAKLVAVLLGKQQSLQFETSAEVLNS